MSKQHLPVPHEPQLSVPPQPSGAGPQTWKSHASAIVSGLQPHTPGVPPPPQVCGDVQLHATSAPQPFENAPQTPPTHGLIGVHPHLPATPPPPHVFVPVQPQLTLLPHESVSVPQLTPSHGLVVSVQPHTFAVPPPPQVFGAAHAAVPQSTL